MNKKFPVLIFDWDGTLMDSTAVIVAALQAACADLDFPVPTREAASYIIGLGLTDAIAYILPQADAADYPRVAERYGHHFRSREINTPLFPGTEEGLRALRAQGHLLAVATGKSRRGLDRALERTGLADYFHTTRCGEELSAKPHPAMVQDIAEKLHVATSDTLVIGDTVHDLQMAFNAGASGVAAAYGAHARAELMAMNPLACFDRSEDLWPWLHQNA